MLGRGWQAWVAGVGGRREGLTRVAGERAQRESGERESGRQESRKGSQGHSCGSHLQHSVDAQPLRDDRLQAAIDSASGKPVKREAREDVEGEAATDIAAADGIFVSDQLGPILGRRHVHSTRAHHDVGNKCHIEQILQHNLYNREAEGDAAIFDEGRRYPEKQLQRYCNGVVRCEHHEHCLPLPEPPAMRWVAYRRKEPLLTPQVAIQLAVGITLNIRDVDNRGATPWRTSSRHANVDCRGPHGLAQRGSPTS